jgi:hypothetical protein
MRRSPAGFLDEAALTKLVSRPGVDPRIWISFARVDDTTPETGDAVQFDADDGQVYVNITLQPSTAPARARVGGMVAGPGEASYFPFVGGDELLVALPEGDVRAGAVIIARLNNRYDQFPTGSVGGKDPSTNAFGMIRTKSALTIESGASILVRSATAGAFLQLDAAGSITLRDGAKGALQMSADVFGYQDANSDVIFQFALPDLRMNLQVGDASMILSGNGSGSNPQSYLGVPSSFTVATAGLDMNNAVEHVLTTEAFCNLLAQVMNVLSVQVAAIPDPAVTGIPLALSLLLANPLFSTASIAPGVTVTAAPPQGTALNAAVGAAISSAFSSAFLKPPGVPGVGQVFPSIGSAGFHSG